MVAGCSIYRWLRSILRNRILSARVLEQETYNELLRAGLISITKSKTG